MHLVQLCPRESFQGLPEVDGLAAVVAAFGGTWQRYSPVPLTYDRAIVRVGIVSRSLSPETCRALYDTFNLPIVRMTWIVDCVSHVEVLPYDEYYPY